VRARGCEADIGDERVLVGQGGQRDHGVHHHGSQDRGQFTDGQVVPLDQERADVTVRLVGPGEQVERLGGRPEHAEQPGADVGDPRGPRAGDLPLVKVDGAGRVPVDLQDARSLARGQRLERPVNSRRY
jgi:hypothetical protein